MRGAPWTDLSFGIASVDVLAPPVKGCHDVQVRVVVHRQDDVFGVWQSQQDGSRLHGTHQHLVPKNTTELLVMLYTVCHLNTRWCRQVTHMSLGWHCSFRMGEGKRNLWSQSPVRTSHCETMLSVEALTSLCPSRLQLHTHTKIEHSVISVKGGCVWMY